LFVASLCLGAHGTTATLAAAPEIRAARVIVCRADVDRPPAVVTGVAITPDGRTMAVATDAHRVLIWDVASGICRACLEGHADWVHSVGLSGDGRTLVSGSGDRSICLWDIEQRLQILRLDACDGAVSHACFHPNNQQVAVVGFSNQLQIINTSSGHASHRLACPCSDVRTVTFSPDGTRLAVAGRNGRIRLWNVDSGVQERDLETGGRRIRALAFSPDSRLLAAGGDGPIIHLIDVASDNVAATLDSRPGKVHALLFIDHRQLAVGGTDNRIAIWDVDSRQVARQLVGHTGTVASLACDAAGQVLVSGGFDTTIRVWNLTESATPAVARSDGDAAR
jgi:WD40 repeat protein